MNNKKPLQLVWQDANSRCKLRVAQLGQLAQLEEHSVYTRKVIGSSPILPIPNTMLTFRASGRTNG